MKPIRATFTLILGIAPALLTFELSAYAASECRTAALPDGTPAMFCRDRNGNWKQQEGAVAITRAAPAGSGAATYADAKYRGVAVYQIPIRTRQRPVRGLGDLLANGMQPTTRPQEILVTTVMRIDNGVITGTITGGGWQTDVPITGTRKNGICNISATNGDSVSYIGKCDEAGFVGKMTTYPVRGDALKGEFNLEPVSFVDTSARDARRAELQAKCDAGSTTACVELEQTK